jgi:hypothetical protein
MLRAERKIKARLRTAKRKSPLLGRRRNSGLIEARLA